MSKNTLSVASLPSASLSKSIAATVEYGTDFPLQEIELAK